MSWRVSFYKADKNEPLTRELDHEDEDGTYENTYINGQEILNNEGTIFWTEKISREEKENPELFEQLWEDPSGDCDYYEVKRPGLKLFIEKYQQHIIKKALGSRLRQSISWICSLKCDNGFCKKIPPERSKIKFSLL